WCHLNGRRVAGPRPGGAGRGQLRASRSARAAAVGSAASVIARTTTTRPAPAAVTSARLVASMPPIANHGLTGAPVVGPVAAPVVDSTVAPVVGPAIAPAEPAACRTRSSPGAGRPGLVGVGQTGPVQK